MFQLRGEKLRPPENFESLNKCMLEPNRNPKGGGGRGYGARVYLN